MTAEKLIYTFYLTNPELETDVFIAFIFTDIFVCICPIALTDTLLIAFQLFRNIDWIFFIDELIIF